MIAVQSLYTRSDKDNFGYNSLDDFIASITLSASLLGKHFEKVVMYTDKIGLEILQPVINLYDEVFVVLDHIDYLESFNWGYTKIWVYRQQTQPFIHVDYDVFLWEGLPQHFKDSAKTDLFFQGREMINNHAFYKDSYLEVCHLIPKKVINKFPEFAVNCGVFGCNDLTVISDYERNSLDFIAKNQVFFKTNDSIHKYHQCILFEQLFIVPLLNKKKVEYILDDDFNTKSVAYTHLIAESKKNYSAIEKVHQRVLNKHFSL